MKSGRLSGLETGRQANSLGRVNQDFAASVRNRYTSLEPAIIRGGQRCLLRRKPLKAMSDQVRIARGINKTPLMH